MHPVTRNTERPASRLSLFVTVVTRVTRADDFAFRWPHHRRKRAGRADSDGSPHFLKGETLTTDCLATEHCSAICVVCGQRPDLLHIQSEPTAFYCAIHCPHCGTKRELITAERWQFDCATCGRKIEVAAGPKRDTVRCPSCGTACVIQWK